MSHENHDQAAFHAAVQAEVAKQSLRRDLVWMHLQAGRKVEDICLWLGVKRDYVEELITIFDRKADFRREQRKKSRIQCGSQRGL
ncbi:MAG: hypothetical protein Q8M16_08210 [Pirellulaceae bacterium]|nr:hypothetical protein [Pirellulaceae bacterium]